MLHRIPAAVLGAAFLLACGQDAAREAQRDMQIDSPAVAAVGDRSELFVDRPTSDAQLVFVGADGTARPADRADAVFVSLATFNVERDGVPNMFPPADSMARMLEAAGVRGDRIIIVGAPIPAGRAFAGFDYLGLGDRAALLDGGPAALASAPERGGAAARDTSGDQARDREAAAARDTAGAQARGRAGGEELRTHVRDDVIVDAEWVHDRLDDPSVVIIDARPPAEFSGETPGADVDRPGHIPGARNVFWQTLVQSADDTRLKSEAELRRIFEEAGVGPDDTIVAYCRTGGQSGFLYAVARHLGYDVRLYDGSYVDWNRTEYAVER
jgi:3-mercaptopyruvate sulfurtransferase SseA